MGLLRVLTPSPNYGSDLSPLVRTQRGLLLRQCLIHGALLFRGWHVDHLETTIDAFGLAPFNMSSASAAPRTRVSGSVFTSNDAPCDSTIPFHHELGQSPDPPAYVFFYCEEPSRERGETPLLDSVEVAEYVRDEWPGVYEKLRRDGVRYRRVLPLYTDESSPIGRSWPTTFGTDDRRTAESKIRVDGGHCEWLSDGSLDLTSAPMQAVRVDPRTENEVFLNSIVAASTGWDDARNDPARAVSFSDGTPLSDEFLDALATFCNQNAVSFRWRSGDLLVVDNRVTMHSRNTFERGSKRRIFASMRGDIMDGRVK